MSYNSSNNNYDTPNGEVTAYITRTNLYTNGGEYTLPNGKNYVGPYHIHPESGAMVGATHTDESHSILIPTRNQSPPRVSSIEVSEGFTYDEYSEKDQALIPSFTSVSEFRPAIDRVEFLVYNEQGLLETINYSYKEYSILSGFNTKTGVATSIEVDPGLDLINEGFSQGFYQVIYNFLRDKAASSPTIPYFIQEISADRTELRLASNTLTNDQISTAVDSFVNELEASPFFEDFFLNFGDGNLSTGIRIALDDETDEDQFTILIKLYEALPSQFGIKDTCWIDLQTAEAISFDVEFAPRISRPTQTQNIKGPNFEIGGKDSINNSTTFQNPEGLVNTILTSSYNELQNILNKKGVNIDVNYEDFNDFIYFSSAESRLNNFYTKVKNIESYNLEIDATKTATDADANSISSSVAILESKITDIVKNFDAYENFLYYTSGSDWTWPKANTSAPYQLKSSTEISNWLGNGGLELPSGILGSASLYDADNLDRLVNSLPNFVKDDNTNTSFFTFMDMIGQHFDVFWTYTKAIGDRYDADNRLDKGISKDLVADVIRSLGVNLYQNNFSSNDLSAAFLGVNGSGSLLPPTGSEVITNYVSASSDLVRLDDVNKEIYKRIFHNLPFLLKTKGTVTGLRTLINTYGIPDSILRISEFGGKDIDNTNDWDYHQSKFNYSINLDGSDSSKRVFIGPDDYKLNANWNSYEEKPETIAFRFRWTASLPDEDSYFGLFNFADSAAPARTFLGLEYTGSAYTSGSYSGSIPSESKYQASLIYFVNTEGNSQFEALRLTGSFMDGNWWGVAVSTGSSGGATLRAANKIYNGNDGFKIGESSVDSGDDLGYYYTASTAFYFPANASANLNSALGPWTYSPSSSFQYQELRFYNERLSEEVFHDYVMNPLSIEGSSFTSSADNLVFRAPLGSNLHRSGSTNEKSYHPKFTGSAGFPTNSFVSPQNSDYYFDIKTPDSFSINNEFIYQDQPAVGIKNRISEKVQTANLITASGDTLTPYTTIQQRYINSESYTRDVNYVEVAFSPQNEINDDINSSFGYFNIGEYIGDPSHFASSSNSYPDLDKIRDDYFKKYLHTYDWKDYVRLIKYFDNSLFKMIKDFIPAKTSVTTGVVIKQHILERNKQRPPIVTQSQYYYTGSILTTEDVAYIGSSEEVQNKTITSSRVTKIKGGQAGVYEGINNPIEYSGSFSASVPLNLVSPQVTQSWVYEAIGPSGSVEVTQSDQREFYTGELSGSEFKATNGELNPTNTSKFASREGQLFYPVDITGDLTDNRNQICSIGNAEGFRTRYRLNPERANNTPGLFGNYPTASIPLTSSYTSFPNTTLDAFFLGKHFFDDGGNGAILTTSQSNDFDTVLLGLTSSFNFNFLNCGGPNNTSGDGGDEIYDLIDTMFTLENSPFIRIIGETTGTDVTIIFQSSSIVPSNGSQTQATIVFHSASRYDSPTSIEFNTSEVCEVFLDTPSLSFVPVAVGEGLGVMASKRSSYKTQTVYSSGLMAPPGYSLLFRDFTDPSLKTIINTEHENISNGGLLLFNDVIGVPNPDSNVYQF